MGKAGGGTGTTIEMGGRSSILMPLSLSSPSNCSIRWTNSFDCRNIPKWMWLREYTNTHL